MRRLLASTGVAALVLTALSISPSTTSAAPDDPPPPDPDPTSRYLVTTAPEQVDDLLASMTPAKAADAKVFAAVGTVVTDLTSAEADSLAARPGVVVSLDGRATASEEASSWGQDRVDQRDLPLDGQYNLPGDGQVTGSGVDAYIIDTGIQPNPQFGDRLGNGIDILDPGTPPDECPDNPVPHGTHVAGTVASDVYGVAPGATLHAVRVLNCQNSGDWSTVIEGMNWVATEHATSQNLAVANMSLGGFRVEAVNLAVANLVNAGVTVVVAAGNEGDNADFYSPGSAPEAITVAASNQADGRALFSNYGPVVDLFAPGVNIPSTAAFGDSPLVLSGTSMASPHVAGWAALYLSSDPTDTSPSAVASQLIATATPGKIDAPLGTPNLLPYTTAIEPPNEPPPSEVPNAPALSRRSVTGTTISLNWATPTKPNGTIEAYRWGWVSENGKPVKRWSRIYNLNEMRHPQVLTNLSPENVYTISLEAINEHGIGEPAIIDVKTGKQGIRAPKAPYNVRGKPGSHKATISWHAPRASRAIDRYQIHRYTQEKFTPGSHRSVVFKHLRNNRTYTFTVRAHNRSGWGPWSTSVKVRPHR